MATVPAAVRQWVEAGFAAQNAGEWDRAEQAYRQALALSPGQPVALQLLGLLARRRGDPVQARALMEASLARQPAQPHVWNNLANTLEELGDLSGALRCLDRAVALQTHYPDAHFNRARVLASQGLDDQAAESLEVCLQQLGTSAQHPTAAQRVLQAQLLDRQGQSLAALELLEAELSGTNGQDGTLLHNLGVLRHRHHQPEQALTALEAALAAGIDAAEAHYNRGNVLQSLGRLNEAVEAYGRALRRDPHHRLSLFDLARLRWRLNQAHWDLEIKTSCELATRSAHTGAAPLWAVYAQLQWRAGHMTAARQAYERAFSLDPLPEHLDGMARCAVRSGHIERGLSLHERALEAKPDDPSLIASTVTSLLLARGAGHAIAADRAPGLARQACMLAQNDQYAWALMSLVWREQEPELGERLLDLKNLVRIVDLPVPTGFDSMSAFNAALAQELVRHHHDQRAPLDQTLRGGTQTLGNLFDGSQGLVALIRDHIAAAIDDLVADLSAQAPEPLLSGLPHPLRSRLGNGWRYADSWSSRLLSGGAHTNHVHPHGWISAVYYVEVPSGCAHSDTHQGWLQLGEPDEALADRFAPLHFVEPRPGRLVMFPSYLWHGTRPFDDVEPRMTIAFDLVPLGHESHRRPD